MPSATMIGICTDAVGSRSALYLRQSAPRKIFERAGPSEWSIVTSMRPSLSFRKALFFSIFGLPLEVLCSEASLLAWCLSLEGKPAQRTPKKEPVADAVGFEPTACSLGGCRHIQARPRAHICGFRDKVDLTFASEQACPIGVRLRPCNQAFLWKAMFFLFDFFLWRASQRSEH
jgi:hypothetical protein